MNFEDKMRRTFAVKNWQVEEYDYDRGDGYAIAINTEEYPEVDALGLPAPAMLNDEQENLIAAYAKAFDEVEAQIREAHNDCTCDGGQILSYSKDRVMLVAKLIPDRLQITA
jgi:hypothetical protein